MKRNLEKICINSMSGLYGENRAIDKVLHKSVCLMTAVFFALTLTACTNSDSKVNQVLADQMSAANQTSANNENVSVDNTVSSSQNIDNEEAEAVNIAGDNMADDTNIEESSAAMISTTPMEGVDVDLTIMSSTMVLSEVSNMMVDPEGYIGKIVRMRGAFVSQIWNDQVYFACLIADATACCSQGLEFVPSGEWVFPDDFPELGSEITVVGEFSTYIEDNILYFTLLDAVIEKTEQ